MANGVAKSHAVNVINYEIGLFWVFWNILYLISVIANEAAESSGLGTGIAIGAAIIVILLIIIGLIFINRNKARPVKNTENVQAAEHKDEQNAAVMSYSSLEANRPPFDIGNRATFNTFHPPQNNNNSVRSTGICNIA